MMINNDKMDNPAVDPGFLQRKLGGQIFPKTA